jgi:hypothetical protein
VKLYVLYTTLDLREHGKTVCSEAKKLGWDLVNGAEIAESRSRSEELAKCDALLLLSAKYYGDAGRSSIEESEWDAAREKGITTGALLVDPQCAWPLDKIQYDAIRKLDEFHSKVRQAGLNLIAHFGLEVSSISNVLPRLLGEIKATADKRKLVNIFVVWDFSVRGLNLILDAFKKKPPEGFQVRVLGVPGEGVAGEIFRDNVLVGIRDSDRVLVITDRPNANVGFEAGLALGFGKPMSLVFFCASLPDWLGESAFKGFVVNPIQDLDELRDVVRNDNNWYWPPTAEPIPSYGKTLFLSPSCYVGSALREEQVMHYPSWRVIQNNRFNLNDLQTEFANVTQVVWCIASFSEGSDDRDGAENAANAIICGWFYARTFKAFPADMDTRFWVMRQKDARNVVDVGVKENTFTTIDQFSLSLREVGKHNYRLPKPLELEEVVTSSGYRMVCVRNLDERRKLWVGKYPVTNGDYEKFCDASRHPKPGYWDSNNVHPDQPVVNVSLDDAQAFCDWAKLELPDESLWEHFARAGLTKKYWWGDDNDLLTEVAWIDSNSGRHLHVVGEKPPNTWCLHDVFGNVWEWTKRFQQVVSVPSFSSDQKEVWRARVFGGAYDTTLLMVASPLEYPVSERRPSIGFRCIMFSD